MNLSHLPRALLDRARGGDVDHQRAEARRSESFGRSPPDKQWQSAADCNATCAIQNLRRVEQPQRATSAYNEASKPAVSRVAAGKAPSTAAACEDPVRQRVGEWASVGEPKADV